MAEGLHGELIFYFTTVDNILNSKMKVSWSETYDISQNFSVFSIDLLEVASPIWSGSMSKITGDLMVDGIPVIRFRYSSGYGRVTILQNMAYSPVKVSSTDNTNLTASITIPHNDDGSKTISVEFLPTTDDGYDQFTVSNANMIAGVAFYMPIGQTANNPQSVILTTIPRSIEPEGPSVIDDSKYGIQEGFEIVVLNEAFIPIQIIDNYESLIWTVRYRDVGDFELMTYMDMDLYHTLQSNIVYFKLEESDRLMVPEKWQIQTDIDNGDRLQITGRSLESVLGRRIVWGQRTFVDPVNPQDMIQALIYENAINPSDEDRKLWNGLTFVSSSDPLITGEEITAQFYGETLLDVIKSICESFNLGFKLIQNGVRNTVEFSLYAGIDRSPEQITRPNVIFSPEYDNLITSSYTYDEATYKNVALVAGKEDSGTANNSVENTTLILGGSSKGTRPEATVGEGSRLSRYEMFVDAGNLSKTVTEGETQRDLTTEEYEALMQQEGINQLNENTIIEQVEASVDPNRTFIFGEDYFLGDIVYVENQYGVGSQTRVIEVIYSEDSSGRTIYPTFEIVE